jgi:small-conductance mechanosensitive channel
VPDHLADELNPPQILGLMAAAAVVALLVTVLIHRATGPWRRRSPLLAEFSARAYRPTQVTVVLFAVWSVLQTIHPAGRWRAPTTHGLGLLLIASVAWLIASLSFVVEDAAVTRYPLDVANNRQARRVRTQAMVIRRLTVVVITVIAVGAMLMTFPTARTAGASLLASAGLAGAIAGLAAQSVLGNVFAGIQIAFTDSVRIDDVVVVEGEWGRVEDITLSYVVVHLWDDRRMVFPTSYFTTTPFQNWTRHEAAILGTVEFDVDWSVPVEDVRVELRRALESTELWDGRVSVLQVTDAINGSVRLRALVSAADAPTAWDLRCLVRERLVGWLREHAPGALPRLRADISTEPTTADRPPDGRAVSPGRAAEAGPDARVFGGTPEGERRGNALSGPDRN